MAPEGERDGTMEKLDRVQVEIIAVSGTGGLTLSAHQQLSGRSYGRYLLMATCSRMAGILRPRRADDSQSPRSGVSAQ